METDIGQQDRCHWRQHPETRHVVQRDRWCWAQNEGRENNGTDERTNIPVQRMGMTNTSTRQRGLGE